MLKINKDTHRIEGIEFYDSCNHDERPYDAIIDTIIITVSAFLLENMTMIIL